MRNNLFTIDNFIIFSLNMTNDCHIASVDYTAKKGSYIEHQTKPSFTLVGKYFDRRNCQFMNSTILRKKTAFYAQLFKEGMLGN